MKHKIRIGDDGIAYVTIIGDGDSATAREFVNEAARVMSDYPGKIFNAVIDMSESGHSDYKGIQIYREFFEDPRLGKLAFLHVSELVRALVALAVKEKKDVKFFDTLEGALAWVQS